MRFTEPLDQGLVTSRPASMLREGELQLAQNVYYQPNDPGLHISPHHATAATFGSNVKLDGLAHCAFDFLEATCDIVRGSTTITVTSTTIASAVTTSGSAIVTAPTTTNFIGVLPGATITASAGIPASTTVLSWDSPTQITMSANATATGARDVTITNTRFTNVTAGATISGQGIPDGTTVSSVGATKTTLVLSAAATQTRTAKVTVKADNLILIQVGTGSTATYQTAKPGTAGTSLTFSTVESNVTAGTAIDQVHYNNQHVLLNGKHPNRVLKSDGLTRPHGLAPVTTAPTLAIFAGVWALKEGAGFYAYWTTEYDSVHDIESDFNLGVDAQNKPVKPPIIQITTVASQGVKITRPARVNDSATHWRIYRSIKYTSTTAKSAAKENKYPNGFLVAQLELRDDAQQTEFFDGSTAATTADAVAGAVFSGTGANGTTWANASAATGIINNGGAADDTNSATLTYVDVKDFNVPLTLYNFSIPTPGNQITGITVTITGRKTSDGKAAVELFVPYTTVSVRKNVAFTTSNSSVTLGGNQDLWGLNWDPSQFTNGKFNLRVLGTIIGPGDKVTVDSVTVTVSSGESQEQTGQAYLSNTGDPYPAVVVSPFGFTISAGRGGQPPKATTGDIFQDSLLTNDVTDSSVARYSFPSRIDAFPAPYFLNFDTREQDEITFIRTVGNIAIIGLKHQIYRVNYLPRDTDSEFERGRAVEIIEHAHGIANRSAATVFTLPGAGQMLAYVNNYGIFMTDGYRVRPLVTDLDWWGTMNIADIATAKFINNTELQVLELYFTPSTGGAGLTSGFVNLKFYFHYHHSHLKGDPRTPQLKVTGPCAVAGESTPPTVQANTGSVTTAGLPNGTRIVYVAVHFPSTTSKLLYENRMDAVESVYTARVTTRPIAAAQLGNEWRINEIGLGYTVRDFSAGEQTQIIVATESLKTGATTKRTSSTKNITVAAFESLGSTEENPRVHRISKVIIPETGQTIAVALRTQCSTTERRSFDFLVLDGEGQGQENPT